MSEGLIKLLPEHVANQIAAGEVVQRPASVVKELLENAVDAKATSISLIVKDAGKTLVQVTDNGKGMNAIDASLCFQRHATSKITIAEDLFSLQTKGFRGEALSSIASIAQVELKTKEKAQELGTHIVLEANQIKSEELAVLPEGTSFLVKNLFFNIPARRNFLKSHSVELRHIIDEFERVALAHPEISFSFISNSSELFDLPQRNLRQRIVNIFGNKINDKLVPVTESTELVGISGFVLKPEMAKKSRGEQFFFVNHRFIKNSFLHHAVVSAFEGLLKPGTFPSYFLYLELPAQKMDINIHPTKTEIKFEDEQTIYAILRAAVKHSLGQFHVVGSLDFLKDETLDVPYALQKEESVSPTIEINTNYNPFEQNTSDIFDYPLKDSKTSSVVGSKMNSSVYFDASTKPKPYWETLYKDISSDAQQIIQSSSLIFESQAQTNQLFTEQDVFEESFSVKAFQLSNKYLVSAVKSGLLVVNQKRAHQRILFEQFLESFNSEQLPSQQLLFPLSIQLNVKQQLAFDSLLEPLKKTGFNFEEISKEKVVICGCPTSLKEHEIEPLFQELLNESFENFDFKNNALEIFLAQTFARKIAQSKAKKMHPKEQEQLINELFACSTPDISPFSKPTYIILNHQEIEKKFIP